MGLIRAGSDGPSLGVADYLVNPCILTLAAARKFLLPRTVLHTTSTCVTARV